MVRVHFETGKQREFLKLAIERLNVVSLRGILQFGFNIPYSTLKNYYSEFRFLPEEFFRDLLEISGIEESEINFKLIGDNWGKVKGGRKSRRGKIYNVLRKRSMEQAP